MSGHEYNLFKALVESYIIARIANYQTTTKMSGFEGKKRCRQKCYIHQ